LVSKAVFKLSNPSPLLDVPGQNILFLFSTAGSDKSRMGQDSVRDKPRIANEDHHKKKSVSAHKHPPPPSFADLVIYTQLIAI
jgi:hypothetical protein